MSTHHNATQEQLTIDRNWFLGLSFAMIFAIVWAILGDSTVKMLFIAVTFVLFLRAGINFEMTSRALNDHH